MSTSDGKIDYCSMDIGVKDENVVGVRGRIQDRVNKGRLGPKGLHGSVDLPNCRRSTLRFEGGYQSSQRTVFTILSSVKMANLNMHRGMKPWT